MNSDDILQESLSREKRSGKMQRRDFVKLTGAGLGGLYIYLLMGSSCKRLSGENKRRELPSDYNAFMQIAEDGTVTCLTGKIEMGQGIITSLAQMMADQLGVAFEKVKMVMGDTDLSPYDEGTWGSLSTREFGPSMLKAADEARAALFALAAEKLKTSAQNLTVNDGVIIRKDRPDTSVSYGELVKGKRIEKYIDPKTILSKPGEHTYMGKAFKRADAFEKVTGKALYAGDYRKPGMMYAAILRPSSHAATLTNADTSAAKKVEGVIVIEDPSITAILHPDPETAASALKLVKASYSFNEKKVDDLSIFDYLLKAKSGRNVLEEEGNPETAVKDANDVVDSTFYNSYVAHSPMETHSALAWMEGEKLTAVVSTQSPFGVQERISRELKLPLEKVRVITPFLGGGFGGKAPANQAIEAARLAILSGKPVMVHWSREEEFFYDTFRPAAVVRIISSLDEGQKLRSWDYKVYFAGSRGTERVYDIPNFRTTEFSSDEVHPFATGAWRAPGNNTNTFARESQVDILASRTGTDPLHFRLNNLKDERMIAVLKAVADIFGYTPSKTPSGRGFGIACGFDAGSYVAHMAEVKVNKQSGEVKVVRVACAQEMGFCVNPLGATLQMEGCIMMGMGYALSEEILFKGGVVNTTNYSNYKLPLFSDMPEIRTKILDNNGPMQGGGEPAIICMGAVIANAIFDATGARLYHLPMTPARVLEALSKVSVTN
ncbi:MAG: xanthine dehydrogenase family protein molybdopterin-binding subunit [Bacteroidetes bacterium]|nr:xanthine dehydrogenase family protein molybdopterin-binding subunit [Bacteroidota bacterium]